MKRHSVAPRPARRSDPLIMAMACTAAIFAVLIGAGWTMVEAGRSTAAHAAAPAQPLAVAIVRRHRVSRLSAIRSSVSISTPDVATPTPANIPTTASPDADQAKSTADHPLPGITDATKRTGFVWNGGNLRAGPGLKHRVVGGVHAGDVVDLVRRENGWWQVTTPDAEGWLSDTLLVIDGETNPLAPSNGGLVAAVGEVMRARARDQQAPRSETPALAPNAGPPAAPDVPDPAAAIPAQPDPTATQRPPQRPSLANGGSLWSITIVPGEIVPLPHVVAPHPFLAPAAVGPFLRARTRVYLASGVDYLGVLDDAFRSVDFSTTKAGVARLSWHKAGRAIDVSLSRIVNGVQGVVFMRDAASPALSRVLIRCVRQDGTLGSYYSRSALGYGGVAGYYVDVTTILTGEGFQRIPRNGSVSEKWHYELTGGLTWAQAMQQLYTLRTLRRLYPEVWR